MFSCNLCDFLLHPLYVYMSKDRVPLLPHPFPVHCICSLILLTGLANDPYLVHRKIMKLREKETRHLRWTMSCKYVHAGDSMQNRS